VNRREFLIATGLLCVGASMRAAARETLADRFSDLSRHFIFEYYPWYRANPYVHWDQWGRTPPIDIASNYMPKLGAYDSRSIAVMEQHAAWIAETGAGAINVSWWGRDSDVDQLIPTLMDVMRAHDVRVAFHIEPYIDGHAAAYASDVEYLIRTYGDRRRWDTMLLLQRADGSSGPVFKSFRTIVPPQSTDCHGITQDVSDYAADAVWRQQTDHVRATFARDFDHVTLLADSLNVSRTLAAGFDGIAIYDNFVTPDTWLGHAQDFSAVDLLFSFNINPGYDQIVPRTIDPNACYSPPRVIADAGRIAESFAKTVAVQTMPGLSNAKRGFFLAYINSFNEWHEGHQFEPMQNAADLTPAERAIGYRNPDNGRSRLDALSNLIRYELDNSA